MAGGRLCAVDTGVSPRKIGTTGDFSGQRALDLDPHIVALSGGAASLELGHPGAANENNH
jgi:hypothetical protein